MDNDWWRPATPKNVKPIPWMGQAAIDHLETLLERWMTVLEMGCGGSTLWLASRVAHVTSYEDDWHWLQGIGNRCPPNVTMLLGHTPPPTPPRYNVLVVDGARQYRSAWVEAAERLVHPGGLAVIDNHTRPEVRDAASALMARHKHTVIDCNQPVGENEVSRYFTTAFVGIDYESGP